MSQRTISNTLSLTQKGRCVLSIIPSSLNGMQYPARRTQKKAPRPQFFLQAGCLFLTYKSVPGIIHMPETIFYLQSFPSFTITVA